MSRITLRAFLSEAKQSLSRSLQSKGEQSASFVIGNESADLDSIICALVYGYIQSSTPVARTKNKSLVPVTNIPSSELRLRPELRALLIHADLEPSELINLDDLGKIEDVLPAENTDWTLVDHNPLQGPLGKHYSSRVVGVIDHHEDEGKVRSDAKPRIIEKTGSCNSHVVNYFRDTWDFISSSEVDVDVTQGQDDAAVDDTPSTSTLDAQVAKLALGTILIDTVNLTAGSKVTEHDHEAVEYLEGKINASPKVGPTYDRNTFYKEINDAKSNMEALNLEEILRKDYKQWAEGDLVLGISSVVQPISYLEKKSENLVPELLIFAQGRGVDLYAVMTAHNASGRFERQLLLLPVKDGKAVEVAEKFVKMCSDELQLESSEIKVEDSNAQWLRMWQQKNLTASRKKVGPLLREAMR